ncbi:hypothetical protein FA15DRAFT_585873 [Coprinopsis marcescibilis]|uniref:Uncharacterized protein n=1 Tax=Coprinopsis marcescibilis TaxID=230819 RepID=A0A5C3L4M5_COPMA|nr:hypothetical protein FA15DRAFT_585873 [Coprinopsis marcescibilis]
MTILTQASPVEAVPALPRPPTKQELIEHYPANFTWHQLKLFTNSGDLGLLKRHIELQKRYNTWSAGVVEKYGSVPNYLITHRLQWGKPDTLSLFKSEIIDEPPANTEDLPPTPYFSVETPPQYISIIQNDWPYSIPPDVEHTVIWTKVPIYHPDLVHESIKDRIEQDGLWGFTGLESPPPSPSELPSHIDSLAEWGITLDKMIVSPKGTAEVQALVETAGREVSNFVRNRWKEDVWETAWFVNPPRLQSIPSLAHIHVFARKRGSHIN